ncbi:Piwi-domain-containing protein [Gyrodon lividus]|nr:Piwi-domain-containing protein [Gyrodon lividus]
MPVAIRQVRSKLIALIMGALLSKITSAANTTLSCSTLTCNWSMLVEVKWLAYLPAEVCEILPDQPVRGKLTCEQSAAMDRVACQPPSVNGDAVVHLGQQPLGPILRSLGMTIGPNMVVVPGRILPKPNILYFSNVTAVNDRASWDLINVKFAVGAGLDHWAVLVIKDSSTRDEFAGARDPELSSVVNCFRDVCNTTGMHVTGDPTYHEVQLSGENNSDPMRKSSVEAIRVALMKVKPKPDLILVMLASGNKAVYEGLKHLCDVFLDVATVCVHSSKIRRRNPQYLASVALKVNMKMGGISHKLDPIGEPWLATSPTMVVGMDVTHPSPGSARGTPSIAAVMASVDSHFA